jgi:hypothetical protein
MDSRANNIVGNQTDDYWIDDIWNLYAVLRVHACGWILLHHHDEINSRFVQ